MKPTKAVAFGLWLLLLVFGAVGVAQRFVSGHELAGYGSYVPWGLGVATYIFFVGLSAGAYLLSSLVYVFGVRRLAPMAPLALVVAAVTLLMGLVTIWFDLGHLGRFYEVYTRPQFHSMMAWMVWLYTAYFVLLLAQIFFALRREVTHPTPQRVARDDRTLKVLGAIGVPLAIAFSGGVGALFASVAAQQIWHSGLYPVLFLAGALTSGSALLTALVAFAWRPRDAQWAQMCRLLGRLVLALVLVDVVLEWAEYSIPLWYGVGREAEMVTNLLFGEFWYVFWVVHVAVGAVVPIVLLVVRPHQPWAIGTAGALVAVSFLAVRLNMVIPSLVTPQLRGLELSYRDRRLSFEYVPSVFEWQLFGFVLALGAAALFLGYRYLPIGTTTKEVQG